MRVAVLHNAVPDDAPLEDRDTLVQVETVVAVLSRLRHEAIALACTLDLAALHERLRRDRPDVVFNLVESLAEADSLAYLPLAVLDALSIPYTGSRTEAMFLTAHKVLAKQRLLAAGLPTPAWIEGGIVHEGHEAHEEKGEKSTIVMLSAAKHLSGANEILRRAQDDNESSVSSCPSCASWIIKGVWDQASRGMDDEAVLRDVAAADVRRRLGEWKARTGRPCFAEQFIEGREFNVAVLAGSSGPDVLPPAEIDFSAFPPEKPHIVGHRAKWQVDSFEYHNTPRHFEFDAADAPLLAQLQTLAAACWNLFALRGWVRVDFRVDRAGQPWILEINTNPCLSPDAGFAAALDNAAIPFDEAVQRILEDS